MQMRSSRFVLAVVEMTESRLGVLKESERSRRREEVVQRSKPREFPRKPDGVLTADPHWSITTGWALRKGVWSSVKT